MSVAPIDKVLDALAAAGCDPKPSGRDEHSSLCPVHQGERRNLSIGVGDSGAVLLKCHAHDCPAAGIVEAIGLTMGDLFPPQFEPKPASKPKKAARPKKVYLSPSDAGWAIAKASGLIFGGLGAECWPYHDAAGNRVMLVYRLYTKDGQKTYRPVHYVQGGVSIGDPPGPLPLYHLDLIGAPGPVWMFEGEKCVDLARGLGLNATTTAHGADSPHKSDLGPLAGRDVFIVPDNDEPGEKYAEAVRGLLGSLSPPARVKVVRLPGLKEKGDDLAEWIELKRAEGRSDQEVAAELAGLADQAEAVAAPPPPQKAARKASTRDARLAKKMRTDMGNGERLAARAAGLIRYCKPWKKWLVWDGRRYAVDQSDVAMQVAKRTARKIFAEASTIVDDNERRHHGEHAIASQGLARLNAMLTLAASEPGVPILPAEMDRDGWLLNCLNGTIDLRTGTLRPHDRADVITQLCPVEFDPYATCPLWDATLRLFFDNDDRMIAYWQRVCGYSLVGLIRDHIMPVAYGDGSNGKSTILGTMMEVLGTDYAMKAMPDLLMAKTHDTHPTDKADLFGKRLVVAIETAEGRRLDEALVKELTGGDKIRARRMRENPWEFAPTHTLIMGTNHKPMIRGTDNGIWRRLKLVPFTVKVVGEKADTLMAEKLRAEYPGILAWAVRGCLSWQEVGLHEPESVTAATSEYRTEQDVIGGFLAERTVQGPGTRARCGDVYKAYKAWAEDSGERAITMTAFGTRMKERGVETKASNGKWYIGIGLKQADDEPAWGVVA